MDQQTTQIITRIAVLQNGSAEDLESEDLQDAGSWALSAVRFWESFLTSLSFHYLIHKMGIMQSLHGVTLKID